MWIINIFRARPVPEPLNFVLIAEAEFGFLVSEDGKQAVGTLGLFVVTIDLEPNVMAVGVEPGDMLVQIDFSRSSGSFSVSGVYNASGWTTESLKGQIRDLHHFCFTNMPKDMRPLQ